MNDLKKEDNKGIYPVHNSFEKSHGDKGELFNNWYKSKNSDS